MAETTNELTPTLVPIDQLVLGPNPRQKQPSEAYLAQFAAVVKSLGIINAISVRPLKGSPGMFEVCCGQTRFRAAQQAGLLAVPVRVFHYNDTEMLEAQLSENIMRTGMHPIDEGESFARLIQSKAHTIDSLAKKMGMKSRSIYNRIQLTQLVPKLRQAFLDGEIRLSHAVKLITLEPADQKRIDNGPDDPPGMWRWDFFEFADADGKAASKPRRAVRSERDIDAWKEKNVRLAINTAAVQHLIPEIDRAQAQAESAHTRILQVSTEFMLPQDPALKKRFDGVLTSRHWQRAGGRSICDYAEKAVIVFGEGQGTVLDVCTNKKKCAKHWPDHQPAAVNAKAKATAKTNDPYTKGTPAYEARMAREAADVATRLAAEARWKKLGPALREAMLAQVKRGVTPAMVSLAVERFNLPSATTVKTLAQGIVTAAIDQFSWNWVAGEASGMKAARAFGVDVKKVADQVLKPEKPAVAPAAPAKSSKKTTKAKKR